MESEFAPEDREDPATSHFYVGLGLAISSGFFIGASFVIKKKALLRLQRNSRARPSLGGHGCMKEWLWWAGLLTMGIGEAANFAAYAYAPASLVTPLGALSVVVTAVLSSYYLKERMNLLGKIGCILCILGSTLLILHAPKASEINSMDELLTQLQKPVFLIYVSFVAIISLGIGCYLGPKYGNTNVTLYILLCSAIGSLTVISCKGFALAHRLTLDGTSDEMRNWLTWVLLFALIFFITVQMNYLNKSLDVFDTSVVTPVYYVFFTTFVIIASAILLDEWKKMSGSDILGSMCAFIVIMLAIFLLNAFKDFDISYSHIRLITRPKREALIRRHNTSSQSDRDESDNFAARSNDEVVDYGISSEIRRHPSLTRHVTPSLG